jgi:hypothetical protein
MVSAYQQYGQPPETIQDFNSVVQQVGDWKVCFHTLLQSTDNIFKGNR